MTIGGSVVTGAQSIINRNKLATAKADMVALIRGWAQHADIDDIYEIANSIPELKKSSEFNRLKEVMENEYGPIQT